MAIDKQLSEPEVRKWLKDKKLADEWWVMLDDEEFNDDPINLDEVFRIHKTLAGQQVVIVQVSEQEKDDPDFISLIMLDKPKRKPLAKKLPVKKLPAKKTLPKKEISGGPPPTTPDIPPTPSAPDSGGPVSPMAQPPAGMPDGPPSAPGDVSLPAPGTSGPPSTPPGLPKDAPAPISAPTPIPSPEPTPAAVPLPSPQPANLPTVSIPEVTRPTGSGGFSAQLEQAKRQLADCESVENQAKQVTETTQASCETAATKEQEAENVLAACKAEKELRSRELAEAKVKLEQSHKACEQAGAEVKACEAKVNHVTEELNKREESLASCQTDQNKWKAQAEARDQQFKILQDSAEKTRAALSSVDDDETFRAAASQANAAAEAMGRALSTAKEAEAKASQQINKLTIEIADLKRQLNG